MRCTKREQKLQIILDDYNLVLKSLVLLLVVSVDETTHEQIGNILTKNTTECVNTTALFSDSDIYMTWINITGSTSNHHGSIGFKVTHGSPIQCGRKWVGYLLYFVLFVKYLLFIVINLS